jgi:hypothetical protein
MDRRIARILGVALLVTASIVGITAVADAGQVRVAGALLGPGRHMDVACGTTFDGDAVAVALPDRFDPGTIVVVSTSDPAGWASGGGAAKVASAALVRVHVPADAAPGDHVIEVQAAGTKDGEPAVVIDWLTVSVRCSGR